MSILKRFVIILCLMICCVVSLCGCGGTSYSDDSCIEAKIVGRDGQAGQSIHGFDDEGHLHDCCTFWT